MTQVEQDEQWMGISEFPGYSVSNRGRVLNDATGFHVKPTKNTSGSTIIGLMKNATQHKRSLPLLVAQAFLSRPQSEVFDTAIHLDGDRSNCHIDNLMWRPLWFSRKYMRQFTDGHTTYQYPIEDIEDGTRYDNSMHAAMTNGLLDIDIYMGMMTNVYVWPTRQIFRKVIDR